MDRNLRSFSRDDDVPSAEQESRLGVIALLATSGKHSIIYASGNFGVSLIGIVALPVLTRVLGQRLYGQYILVYQILNLAMLLGSGWASSSIVRFLPASERKSELIVSTFAALAVAFLALSVPVGLGVSFLLDRGDLGLSSDILFYVVIEAVLALFFAHRLLAEICRAIGSPFWYSAAQIVNAVSRILAGIVPILFLGIAPLLAMYMGWLAGLAGIVIVLALRLAPLLGDHPKLSPKSLKVSFRYGIPLGLNLFFSNLLASADRFVIQAVMGSSAVSQYDVSYRIARYPIIMISSGIMLAAYPSIVRYWEAGKRDVARAAIPKLAIYMTAAIMPIAILISMLASEIIMILFGRGYSEGASIVPYISAAAILLSLNQYSTLKFLLARESMLYASLNLGATIANILLNIVLIPAFGIVGAGVSAFMSYLGLFVASAYLSRREVPWRLSCKEIGAIIFPGSILAISVARIRSMIDVDTLGGLAVAAIAGAIIYLALQGIVMRKEIGQAFRSGFPR